MKIGTVGGVRVGTDSTGSKEPRTVPYTRTPLSVPVPHPYRTHRTVPSDVRTLEEYRPSAQAFGSLSPGVYGFTRADDG
jgi:hypothetical protein